MMLSQAEASAGLGGPWPCHGQCLRSADLRGDSQSPGDVSEHSAESGGSGSAPTPLPGDAAILFLAIDKCSLRGVPKPQRSDGGVRPRVRPRSARGMRRAREPRGEPRRGPAAWDGDAGAGRAGPLPHRGHMGGSFPISTSQSPGRSRVLPGSPQRAPGIPRIASLRCLPPSPHVSGRCRLLLARAFPASLPALHPQRGLCLLPSFPPSSPASPAAPRRAGAGPGTLCGGAARPAPGSPHGSSARRDNAGTGHRRCCE
ncbi:uncharacterized protein LOC110407571 [Numida meleagris]|uniref:uncharacterized protein LOC110407571 n=1 Tax=Numida meleagris TaxID=8996 RepID=UPI000B3DF437|nr:uncharacterized protein LOC110407571 [Numida meleagris]